jgi:hypothetical protein
LAELESAAKDKRLLDFLGAMKDKRAALTALTEQVQTFSLRENQGLFTGLDSKSATFKWAKPNLFYADASQEMLSCGVFRIGCDGQKWWWHIDKELVVSPVRDMHRVNVCLGDPFDLVSVTPAEAARESHLAWSGTSRFGGRETLALTSWDSDGRGRWFIDPNTHLAAGVEQNIRYGVYRTRFIADALNETIPAAEFAMPRPAGLVPKTDEPLDEGYTNRFVNIRDGSDGRMSVRWGRIGPKGRSSSGLN